MVTPINEAYYLEQAAACAAEAAAATLPNARERALRAEENWLRLAGQQLRVDRRRDEHPHWARS